MKRLTALLLCLTLFLCACGDAGSAHVPTGDALSYDEDYTGPVYTKPPEDETQELMLTYYPGQSLNPYKCTDFTNRALFSLIYQSLFIVDRDYQVQPLLCKGYKVSDDLMSYTFYIEDATFSDGSPVTVQDVVDSIKAAQESDIYKGRFYRVTEVAATADAGVSIKLNTAYENFPLLLDIPILPSGQLAMERPIGSGPYILDGTGHTAVLRRRTNWWCSPEMAVTAPTVALMVAESTTQIRDEFQFGDLDLVCADPGSDSYSDFRSDFELWDCENGIFLYLTCSASSGIFSDPEIRSALTYAIDREFLADDFYRGFARPASLPASPLSPWYSQGLAEKYSYDKDKFTQAIKDKIPADTVVTLLVNSDDSLRLRVAYAIEDMLEACGLSVQVKAMTGDDYLYTLSARNFDLYLGQTMLSANMDLSAFFSSSGALRYGGLSDVGTYTLCMQALENHGNYYTLHKTVMDNGMLCPILFRSYAVYATRGLLTGLAPSRDNVFYYSLGKTMEDALIKDPA